MLFIKKDKLFNIIWTIYIITMYCFPEQIFKIEIVFIILGIFFIKKIKMNFYFFWCLVILILFFISNIRAENLIASRIIYYYFMKNLLVGYMLINIIKTRNGLEKIMRSYIYAGVILIIRILMIFPFQDLGKIRLNIPDAGFNANVLALNWGVSLIFLLYFIHKSKKKLDIVYLFFIIIMIILTESRKGIILMLLGIISYPLLLSKNKKCLLKRIIIFFTLGIIILYISSKSDLISEKILNRFFLLIEKLLGNTQVIDQSAEVREEMIKEGIALIKNKVFLGYGLGEFSLYSKYGTYSHNNYIELLVGVGIIGTFFYYLIYIYLIFKSRVILKLKEKRIIPFLIITLMLFILDLGLVSYAERFWIIYLALSFTSTEILYIKFRKGD